MFYEIDQSTEDVNGAGYNDDNKECHIKKRVKEIAKIQKKDDKCKCGDHFSEERTCNIGKCQEKVLTLQKLFATNDTRREQTIRKEHRDIARI